MRDVRIFTPESANSVLPQVKSILTEIIIKETELDSLRDDLEKDRVSRTISISSFIKRHRADSLTREISQLVSRLEELGCLLKDVDTGLVDFPAMRLGEQVYLCWKIGEPSVTHWHTVYEGFQGRRPIVVDEFFPATDEKSETVN